MRVPRRLLEAGVIRHGRQSALGQPGRGLLGCTPRHAVDDAGVLRVLVADEIEQLVARALLRADAIADVGAVEAGDEGLAAVGQELVGDLAPGALVGGGGERDARHVGEALAQHAELQVLGAEIVAPLRHAVRLVDREQRDLDALELRQRARLQQALGRDVEEIQLAGGERALGLAALGLAQCRVEAGGGHAVVAQRLDLVAHQRDQRRDHHRGAGAQQRGHLVAQRLAAAGGHEHQRVAPGEHGVDDGALLAAEVVEAEHPAQEVERGVLCRLRGPGHVAVSPTVTARFGSTGIGAASAYNGPSGIGPGARAAGSLLRRTRPPGPVEETHTHVHRSETPC